MLNNISLLCYNYIVPDQSLKHVSYKYQFYFAVGSSSSEAPRSRSPVVAAVPLDPALVDLIAALVAAQLKGPAEIVWGATEGERPGRGLAPSEDIGRGDSPSERPNRESGGKE